MQTVILLQWKNTGLRCKVYREREFVQVVFGGKYQHIKTE